MKKTKLGEIMLELTYSPSERFASEGHYFYAPCPSDSIQGEKGHWYRIECYLPPSTGVFNEPLSKTRDRYFEKLESGEMEVKKSIEARRYYFEIVDNHFKRVK